VGGVKLCAPPCPLWLKFFSPQRTQRDTEGEKGEKYGGSKIMNEMTPNNMKTYICFNDESGDWKDKKRKFYIRASLIIDSTQLKTIENEIKKIRNELNLSDLKEEIKWQDFWNLRHTFKNNRKPKQEREKKIYEYLKNINNDYHLLIDYCEKVLHLLKEFDCKVILTFTERLKYLNHKEIDICKFHIQDHLQRIQMQFNNDIVVIIYDNVNETKKKIFKEIFNEIIANGDFVKEYNSVFSSLLFDESHDNVFLQMVDFIAGSFSGILTSIVKYDEKNYKKAIEFFCDLIYPRLCSNQNEIWGIGIKETPKDDGVRGRYKNLISEKISTYNDIENNDIEEYF